ncbi:3-keto-5-aminohexanoate cleavage enzyme [Betaproteobacteria bacterium]|nr:3-keto-5-aminohexanoate cleavage enzyme [Betaproteobacteria bacterium]
MDKLIISVGVTGSRITREQTPYIPITPAEIAQSAIDAWKAGASILHVHVRDLETGLGTQDVALFKEVLDRIRSETDAIVSLTTSGIPGRNLPMEERLKALALKPDMVSFDAGSINLGDKVFLNPPEFLATLAKELTDRGIRPEIGVFEIGNVYDCIRLAERGLLALPLFIQFVLSAKGGMPANVKSLLHLSEIIPPDANWAVVESSVGFLPLAIHAIAMGGHVRVGLEECIYYSEGRLSKSNAEQVERVVRMAQACGRELATPVEARKILSLP